MDQRQLNDWFKDFQKSLQENTSALVRIEERLGNFIDRVKTHEDEIEQVKEHVQTVKTIGGIATLCLGAGGVITLIVKLINLSTS